MTSFIKNRLHSLQFRLTLIVIFLTVILAAASYGVYTDQLKIKQSIQKNSQLRSSIVDKKNIVHAEVIESYKTLDTFLLDPRNVLAEEWISSSLNHGIQTTKEMLVSEWVTSKNQTRLVESIYLSLTNLKQEINHLTEIRKNPEKQYPSLMIATKRMRPGRVIFINAISIALSETEDDPAQAEIQKQLINIRFSWSQLVSNFRIYLANQFGAFDILILKEQEKSITVQYKNLIQQINNLKKTKGEQFNFETADAVGLMLHALTQWYDAFVKVELIHNTQRWRVDLNLLKTKIQPLLEEITYFIGLFDEEIKLSEEQDKASIKQIINNQLMLLYSVSGGIIILMIIMLYVIRFIVFRPIGQVTSAIKEEATGLSTQTLPDVHSAEARDLVDAFNEMRKQIHIRQDDLSHQANHDSLTGLPNRKYFIGQLKHHLQNAKNNQSNLAILLIDLNGFKDINDTLGHQIGDKLLIKVGGRLRKSLAMGQIIARLGGDEFAILLPGCDKAATVAYLEKVQKAIEEKFNIDGINTYIGMSIGAALFPEHGDDENILVRHADIAMYVAKKQKLGYAFYKSSDDSYTLNRLSIIHDIKNSIEHKGLILYFQPKYNLVTNQLESVEALLRWNHPEFGMVMPDDFIAIAEQSGFINQISYWAIEEALIQACHWKEHGYNINVAINLSVYNLFDADFPGMVRAILHRYQEVAGHLIFEITESAMMTNPKVAISNLNKLRLLGTKLSIDDYGTGFSSLSYLSQLSLNELKIDKSFVMDMLNDERKSIIVQSTIEMAHRLKLDVVAEGVENRGVLNRLREYGCNVIQGYFISKPLPEDEFLIWLNSYQTECARLIS